MHSARLVLGVDGTSAADTMNEGCVMDVLVVQREPLDGYPPSLNQVRHLARAGLKVGVLDGGIGEPPILEPNIAFHRPMDRRQDQCPGSGLARAARLARFELNVLRVHRRWHPKTRILLGRDAIAMAGIRPFKGTTIAHFHEYPGRGRRLSSVRRGLTDVALRAAGWADLVVVPDRYRARLLRAQEGWSQTPVVVRNCPMRLDQLPSGRLRREVGWSHNDVTRIALFQGTLSVSNCPWEIVRSMQWWPAKSGMVFLGAAPEERKRSVLQLADKLGLVNRVAFLNRVPYSQLFQYTVGADVTLSVLQPASTNFKYSSGASNKRFESMACGVAQVADAGRGLPGLIERNGVGCCVREFTPVAIGRTVGSLLADDERRSKMGRHARELHLRSLNYEVEFKPVLDFVLQSVRDQHVEPCRAS